MTGVALVPRIRAERVHFAQRDSLTCCVDDLAASMVDALIGLHHWMSVLLKLRLPVHHGAKAQGVPLEVRCARGATPFNRASGPRPLFG